MSGIPKALGGNVAALATGGPVGLARKNWKLILGGALALAAAIYIAILHGEIAHWKKLDARDAAGWAAEKAVHAADLAAIRQKTAQAQADDAAHAAAVDRDQARISQQKAQDYENQIADLRRRYAALGLRGPAGAAAAGQGGGGKPPVPGLPDAAGGADGAAAAGADAPGFACSANAIQLQDLEDWLRREAAVPRDPPSPAPVKP